MSRQKQSSEAQVAGRRGRSAEDTSGAGRGADDRPFRVKDIGRGKGEGAGPRTERLQHLLFEEVDRLFRLEINDRRLQDVAPVALELSSDLRNAKVMYGMRGKAAGKTGAAETQQDRAVREGLTKVTPFLRARVAEALSMKRVPDLHFHRDRVAEGALRAAALLATEKAATEKAATPAGPAMPSAPSAADT